MRKEFLILASLAAAAASAGGCAIGEGSGSATGMLWMLGCNEGQDLGTEAAPKDFDLEPSFFAAEPIEDISEGAPTNRLIIRMQRDGNATEITDTLYFDIRDSAEIARCLRGKTNAGVPDYDATSSGSLDPTVPAPWCMPPVTAGLPRIRLVPFGPVAVSFAPLASCHSSMHPPAIVNITGVAEDGWIDFQDFGGAIQPDEANIPPDDRDAITNTFTNGFKVSYDERLQARFNIAVMGDERVAAAKRDKVIPPTDPQIGGTLAGYFDFDFKRGRSAQTFP